MSFKIFLLLIFVQFGRPQDFFEFLMPFRLALVLTMVTLCFTLLNKEALSFAQSLKFKESKLFYLFFLVMILGIPFAYHRRFAFDYVLLKYVANVILFFIVVANVYSFERLKKIMLVVCVAILFQAGMSLLFGQFRGGRFFPGTMYDPNDLAFILVSFIPLFFIFLRKDEQAFKKLVALSGIFLSIIVTLFTGSRGGVVGLGVIFSFVLFSKIVFQSNAAKIFLFMVAGIIIGMNADRLNVDRLQSITDISSDYNMTSETGRWAIWKRGIGLALANPVTGVGVSCFPMAIGGERSEEGEIPKWQAVHSAFVQVLSETGFIGFLLFMSLVFSSLKNFRILSKQRTAKKFATGTADIPGLCMIGLIGTATCGFFLTQGYSTNFVFYFALSAVLRNLFEQGKMDEYRDLASL